MERYTTTGDEYDANDYPPSYGEEKACDFQYDGDYEDYDDDYEDYDDDEGDSE